MFVSRRLLSLLTILIFSPFVDLMPIDSPSLVSTAGETVRIPCSRPEPFQSADWVRLLRGELEEKEICLMTGICVNGYARRFSVDTKNNFTLTIHDVTVNDSGEYTCIAYKDATYSRYTTKLIVIRPPYIQTIAGNTVEIHCNDHEPFQSADWARLLRGEPEENEICLMTGICLNGYAKRFSVDTNKKFMLTIRNVTVNDTGEYTCIAYKDATYSRYTTKLNVTASLHDIHDQLTTQTTLTAVTDTHRDADEDWTSASISVIATALGISLLLIIVVTVVLIVKYKHTEMTHRWPRLCITKYKTKETEDVNEGFRTNSEEPNATDFMSVDQESRALLIATLKLFRQFYNGSNETAAAAKSFKLIASTSALWLNILTEKNGARRRVRRLLYYECSGYRGTREKMNQQQLSPFSGPVSGVAVLDGKVYAVCQGSNIVRVHVDTILEGEIVVDGMTSPVDMVACKSEQILYVADEKQCCIWRVQIGGKVIRWKELKELAPKALSLKNRTVTITCSNVLVKCSRNGKILTRIDVGEGIEPLHAVETSANTFIACCKLARANLVLEVGLGGLEIRRFVCVTQMLRSPSYIVLDKAGHILVADSSNNRILLLDSKLKHGCAILNQQRDGIVAPRRLCLDQCTGRLLIAQCNNSNSIGMFHIKRV